ncbi:MAG: hypothetical protein ACJ8EO_07220 [Sphingomicrobium sp.]
MSLESFAIVFGEALRKIIDERIVEASAHSGDDAFNEGYLAALHRVFTLMQQTASANGVTAEDVSMGGVQENDFFR